MDLLTLLNNPDTFAVVLVPLTFVLGIILRALLGLLDRRR